MTSRKNHYAPHRVSNLLEGVLRQCGLSDRLNERSLLLRWAEIVGQEIASHSRAVDIKEGILFIEADHGAWRQEVTMLMPMIIQKFNAMYGEGTVTDIQWQNGPGRGRRRDGKK